MLRILNVSDEPLFSRVRVLALQSGPTPRRSEAIEAIATALNARRELVALVQISTTPDGARIEATVYKDEESLHRYEPKWRLARTESKGSSGSQALHQGKGAQTKEQAKEQSKGKK